MVERLTAVVPTLGRSPWLVPCLKSIKEDDPSTEVVLIDQGDAAADLPEGLADRVLRPGRNLGFAAATNVGIAESARELFATINDDALIEPGWTAFLIEALDRNPRAAAAQGVNLKMDSPGCADGCGITWNRWTQAVQSGHGEPAPLPSEPSREVFGVSATAAIYRRQAVEAVGLFDPRLISYYEDVDLAARLRAAGWSAFLIPAARSRHAGSATGETLSRERWRLIYANRWLVAARTFGRSFWLRVPAGMIRDGIDLSRALAGGDLPRVAGIVGGWGRAVRHAGGFAHLGRGSR